MKFLVWRTVAVLFIFFGTSILPSLGSYEPKLGTIIFLFWILVALNALDAHSTYTGLMAGATEKNPTLSILMEKVGILPAMMLVKLPSLLLLAVFLVLSAYFKANKTSFSLLVALLAYYAYVVVCNYYIIYFKIREV